MHNVNKINILSSTELAALKDCKARVDTLKTEYVKLRHEVPLDIKALDRVRCDLGMEVDILGPLMNSANSTAHKLKEYYIKKYRQERSEVLHKEATYADVRSFTAAKEYVKADADFIEYVDWVYGKVLSAENIKAYYYSLKDLRDDIHGTRMIAMQEFKLNSFQNG